MYVFKWPFSWDYRDKSYWQRRNVPGPRSLPIFGQLSVLSLDRRTQIHGLANKHIAEWSQRFGKVFGFKQGGRSVLAISDPNLVHEITVKKADCFLDRFVSEFKPILPWISFWGDLTQLFRTQRRKWVQTTRTMTWPPLTAPAKCLGTACERQRYPLFQQTVCAK